MPKAGRILRGSARTLRYKLREVFFKSVSMSIYIRIANFAGQKIIDTVFEIKHNIFMQLLNVINHIHSYSFKPMNWLKEESVWCGRLI